MFAVFLMLIGAGFFQCLLFAFGCTLSKRQGAMSDSVSGTTKKAMALQEQVAHLTAENLELMNTIKTLEEGIPLRTSLNQLPKDIFLTQSGERYHIKRTCQHLRGRHNLRTLSACLHCSGGS